MSENEALRMALIEVDLLRNREADALRDSQASFRVLDKLIAATTVQRALDQLLALSLEEFGATKALIVQATTDGDQICSAAQAGVAPNLPEILDVHPDILHRPRRLLDVARLGAAIGAAKFTSALMAPLPLGEGPPMAIVVLFSDNEPRKNTDLARLSHMARVAVQPLRALRLAQRNADLVALIDGHRADPVDDGLDPSFQAVNRAYGRLTQGQALAVDLLNDLLTATHSTLNDTIDKALSDLSRLCDADRSYVVELQDDAHLTCTHEWVAPGVPPLRNVLNRFPAVDLEPWLPKLLEGQEILIQYASASPHGRPESRGLLSENAKSLLITPMLANGQLHGFVGFEMISAPRSFLQGEIFLLRSAANAISAVTRQHRTEDLNRQAQHALNRAHNRLQATLAALPDLVVELDDEGRFVDHYSRGNGVMSRIASQLMGRTLQETLDAKLATQGHEMLDEVKATGRSLGHTFRYDVGNGDLRWIRASATRREADSPTDKPGYLFVLRDITRETTQAEDIALLDEVAKRASNLIVVTDTQRRITWVNAAFERVTGWTRDEVKGTNPARLLQSDLSDPRTINRIRSALEKSEPVHAELINTRRNGEVYWIELDIQPMFNERGILTGFMAIETEITERKNQEAAIEKAAREAKQAQDRLIAAVESLEDGFVLFDKNGRLVICNDRYRGIAPGFEDEIKPGVTLTEILQRGLQMGHYPEAIGREQEWLETRLSAHDAGDVSLEVRLSDGRWIRVFDKITPDGGRVGLRIDITALKEAEARALSDRAAAMDAARDGMAISSPDGILLYANLAFRSIFGVSPPISAIGRNWSALVGQDAATEILENGLSHLVESGENWTGEVRITRQDGSLADIELSLTRRADGALVWVVRDLAERRQAELETNTLRETLQIAQRREVIGQLAAGLAHDFNNLIAAISGSATLIAEDDGDGAIRRAHDHAQRIQKSAERAEIMVRKLLALGARPSSTTSSNLNAIVREATELLRPGLGRKIRFSFEQPVEPLMTKIEQTDILQIVLNLGINARDAMAQDHGSEAEKHIRIQLREATLADVTGESDGADVQLRIGVSSPERNYACLIVEDTGPRIECATADKIFTPYFSTKGEKGSGLGLSIVSGVVTAAQGSIQLLSTSGKGSIFKVLLPLSDPEGIVATPVATEGKSADSQTKRAASTTSKQPLKGVSILVVDDDEDVLSVITAMLERAGAEVAPTSDPHAAIEILLEDSDAFNLVLTDFDMGETTGADLARAVHQRDPGLPVILITALPDWRQRDSKRQEDPSFFAVLGKPLSSQGLVDIAIAALDSRQN
ncbi:MAG: PAS domain S-box protein [Rhodobacteraceae bacterium]|nr:PAS domain S-box protein [Paracoccaceae bacterium]MCF8516121.1 PAS domain S-box protein [Paracoccaceae bacterium]MCF8520572.1 PAS domain S-box protein [Paracoccaceae bacterium]